MANQNAMTRNEFVTAHRKRAEDMGAALGVLTGIGLIATGTVALSPGFLSIFIITPLLVYGCTALGALGMSLLGGAYAEGAYSRRYSEEFKKTRALANAIAEDPQITPASPEIAEPISEELLLPPLPLPPPEKKRWTDMFHRHDSHAEDVLLEKALIESDQHSL